MKKLMLVVLALALALSISCLAIPAGAVEFEENQADAYMTIQPREFMTLSRTQRVVYNSSLNLAVDITVNFTVRGEAGNKSGFYITGMHSASAKKVSGWTAVASDVKIDVNNIVYRNSYQTAAVPVIYRASTGSGYDEYTAIVLIEL